MSEYGNGAKKGPTHCAPLNPDCNDPSAVLIFSTEKEGILRESGAITVAQEVLDATNSKMVSEMNGIYIAILQFYTENEKYGGVLKNFAERLGYFPLGLKKEDRSTGFPINLHQMWTEEIKQAYIHRIECLSIGEFHNQRTI